MTPATSVQVKRLHGIVVHFLSHSLWVIVGSDAGCRLRYVMIYRNPPLLNVSNTSLGVPTGFFLTGQAVTIGPFYRLM